MFLRLEQLIRNEWWTSDWVVGYNLIAAPLGCWLCLGGKT
uniref:Uncharacterized protein n=1 Tax=Rhizophora mucronata TaxID=61149 RepID=A0A2P2NTY1_RHIMU